MAHVFEVLSEDELLRQFKIYAGKIIQGRHNVESHVYNRDGMVVGTIPITEEQCKHAFMMGVYHVLKNVEGELANTCQGEATLVA